MLAISRFRYDDAGQAATELAGCLEVLAARPGYRAGTVGRALDDPELWIVQSHWADVGSYRRALASYEAKVAMGPLMARVVDEPSAYEVVVGEGATIPNEARPRGALP